MAQAQSGLPGQYRAEAAKLRKHAEATKRDFIRTQLLAMARDYDDLARTVERIERWHQGKGFTSP
jgi:hypothetical protein